MVILFIYNFQLDSYVLNPVYTLFCVFGIIKATYWKSTGILSFILRNANCCWHYCYIFIFNAMRKWTQIWNWNFSYVISHQKLVYNSKNTLHIMFSLRYDVEKDVNFVTIFKENLSKVCKKNIRNCTSTWLQWQYNHF